MQMMSEILEHYAASLTSSEDALLQAINEQTTTQHAHAHMLSGHVQGKLLEFISCMVQPKYILEIGTFTGYSALCLAKGLQKDGALHTIDIREADVKTAGENFSKSKYANRLFLHCGNALEIVPTLDYTWDLVFIDADKTSYIAYYDLVVPRLSERGVIIADNVLFHGQVLEQPVKGKNAKAMDAFNHHVAKDTRTEQVLLTIRDGLLLIKNKS